ncbi:MAG: MazG family protein [Candidatus Caenarcaniphilales bacterium]|nr:MazG family protein [Candidatus Caenarcaniphilales bacterium]
MTSEQQTSTEKTKELTPIEELIETVAKLRSPEGCPWDKVQTHESLKKYLIEEAYEVLEAIDKGSIDDLQEELGDILFQVCIHAQIEEEKNNFSFMDIAKKLNDKMVSRHPHVFAGVELENEGQVISQWEKIKANEKPKDQSPFGNIPKELPSLMRGLKVLKKADKLNLEFKADERLNFLNDLIEDPEELGNILLHITLQAKKLKLDPEEALRQTVAKIQIEFERQIPQSS